MVSEILGAINHEFEWLMQDGFDYELDVSEVPDGFLVRFVLIDCLGNRYEYSGIFRGSPRKVVNDVDEWMMDKLKIILRLLMDVCGGV